jgi:hypothetical protein
MIWSLGGYKIRSKSGQCDVEGSPGGLGQTRLKADDLGYPYGSRRIRVKGTARSGELPPRSWPTSRSPLAGPGAPSRSATPGPDHGRRLLEYDGPRLLSFISEGTSCERMIHEGSQDLEPA